MHVLDNPLESTGEQTKHKSWRELWVFPHSLTKTSQLMNFSTMHSLQARASSESWRLL